MNTAAPPIGRLPAATDPWLLSVVIPAQRSALALADTLERLGSLPGGSPHEIIVVESAADDATWAELQRLSRDWQRDSRLVTLRSAKGLGAAYRAGVRASRGNRVLLTADDLPFGTSDVEAVLACRSLPSFAIGSRTHPRSRVPRSLPRRIATATSRLARRATLGLDVGDPRGTFVIEGDLARRLVAGTTLPGPGMTTELVTLASRDGTAPVELPVALRRRGTRRRGAGLRDVAGAARSGVDLLRLRHRLGRGHRVVRLPQDPRSA